eukprot:Skav230859  [mRNA]  locus=scaffold1335:61315:66791:- [translate_table: standard]
MVGQTVFNPRSSRSHAVATIHICWNDAAKKGQGNETRLYIVDLAGSERSGQYATSTEQLREGAHINLSLSTLGRVVSALSRGHGDHVPHRDSALTWLLTDAITGHQARAFMTRRTMGTLWAWLALLPLRWDVAGLPRRILNTRPKPSARSATRMRVLVPEDRLRQFR